MRYTNDDYKTLKANLARQLEEGPEDESFTKQQMVRKLASDIAVLLKNGHRYEKIAARLVTPNFKITPGTMRSCLRREKRGGRRQPAALAGAAPPAFAPEDTQPVVLPAPAVSEQPPKPSVAPRMASASVPKPQPSVPAAPTTHSGQSQRQPVSGGSTGFRVRPDTEDI